MMLMYTYVSMQAARGDAFKGGEAMDVEVVRRVVAWRWRCALVVKKSSTNSADKSRDATSGPKGKPAQEVSLRGGRKEEHVYTRTHTTADT